MHEVDKLLLAVGVFFLFVVARRFELWGAQRWRLTKLFLLALQEFIVVEPELLRKPD